MFDYKNSKRAEKEYEEIIRKEEEVIRGALSKAENADAANTAIFKTLSEATKDSREKILSMASSAIMNIDDKDNIKVCIEGITKAGEQLNSIIENILNISGMETRKLSLKKVETSIGELMHIIIDEAKDKVEEKNINLDLIAKNISHEAVVADAVRLSSVFSSVMDNAVKYTENGGTIRVSVSEKDCDLKGYASYEFKFSDTGIGMTEQYVEKLFDSFNDNCDIDEFESKGFGLIAAKNIIDVMGGKITIESEKNVGTTVFVNVTLKISDNHNDVKPNLGNIYALILEKDEADALAISDILKESGAECEIFLARRKAIDVAASAATLNHPFNTLLIDDSVIKKDDIDILQALKPMLSQDAKIIAMSPYKIIENRELSDSGVTGVLRKPLFMSDLYSVLGS